MIPHVPGETFCGWGDEKMGYKIMTYETPEQLMHPASRFGPYRDAIHITATNSLRDGMQQSNNELVSWLHAPIISFADLARVMGHGWFQSETEFQQFILLSEALRLHVEQGQVEHVDIHSAVDKNQAMLLSTMRTLREAGICSEEISFPGEEISMEEKTFIRLYRELEASNAFETFDDWMAMFERDVLGCFSNLLDHALTERVKTNPDMGPGWKLDRDSDIKGFVGQRFTRPKKVVLHGFYFLLPIQKRIFDILSREVDVVHVVNHIEGFRRGFEPVERFLDLSGTPRFNALDIRYPVNVHAKRFLEALNGQFEEGEEKNGDVYRFKNLYQFKEYAKQEKHILVSPKAHKIRGYMSDLEEMGRQQLSRYPFGRFLLDVHRLNTGRYDAESDAYTSSEDLSIERVQRIFQSGFLIIEGVQATHYLKPLMRVSRLLEREKGFEGWFRKLDELIALKMEIERKLRAKHDRFDGDLDHRLYARPHEMVGHLKVSIEEIEIIKKGLQVIQDLYRKLFKAERANIKDYVGVLNNHITGEIMPSLQNEADKKIAEEVIESLRELQESPLEVVDQRDLVRGLEFFLAGRPEEDGYESEINGREQSGSQDLVQAMLNSDGLQFSTNRQIHFCVMDQKSFPYTQTMNLWPLKPERMQSLFEKSVALSQLKIRKDLEFEIACYLFYLLMCNGIHLKFSFIQEFEKEKALAPSFYLELMGLSVAPPATIEEGAATDEEEEEHPRDPVEILLESNNRFFEGTVKDTYKICTKRAVYSFLYDDHPVFESEFHEGFVFQGLLLLGRDREKEKEERWRNRVGRLFPHLSETKKMMLDAHYHQFWDKKGYRERYIYLEGERYELPQKEITLFGRLPRGPHGFEGYVRQQSVTATPGQHCMYCPFEKICRESSRKV